MDSDVGKARGARGGRRGSRVPKCDHVTIESNLHGMDPLSVVKQLNLSCRRPKAGNAERRDYLNGRNVGETDLQRHRYLSHDQLGRVLSHLALC